MESRTAPDGSVAVPPTLVPKPGDPPVRIAEAECLLVNLRPGEARLAGDTSEAPGGLLALWWKCPHVGCAVPWDPDYAAPTDAEHRTGWFHCPCHGSTYTKAGVRLSGPAPRSMDTMKIDVGGDGALAIQSGERQNGGPDNPRRVVAYDAPGAGT